MADQISWLTPRDAQDARAELLAALGTENEPGQWMTFMDAVTRLLPAILKSGRPTEDAIKNSVIGRLGFGSWRAMIEAPTNQGGLGWNWAAWAAWRRAWKVVQDWPYLLELPITAAEVNRVHQETKDRPEGFPASGQALEAWKQLRRQEKTEKRAESLESLRVQVKELETQVRDLTRAKDMAQEKAKNLEERGSAMEDVLSERNRDLGKLQAQHEAIREELDDLKKQAQRDAQALAKTRKALKRYQGLSRWDHIKAAFGR